MLDEDIINQIIDWEDRKRKDSGWQPIPLYKELELPGDIPPKKEKSPSGPIEIDIWGPPPDDGLTVIQASSYYPFQIIHKHLYQ